MGRTPSAVSYKLANFASIDPSLPRKGASHASKLDIKIWNEFFDNWDQMTYESEISLSQLKNKAIATEDNPSLLEGKTAITTTHARINQSFFRRAVLVSYGLRCCITGLEVPELLVASHIVPWAKDTRNRTNPQNGLCLNCLHDKAFDIGLITITEDYTVKASPKLQNYNSSGFEIITSCIGERINLPCRFVPSQEFLEYHRNYVFQKK